MATRTADAHRHVHGESVQRLFHEKTRPPRSVPQQFREKLAQHTPTNTTPGTKLAPHTPTNTTPGTKLSPHTPTRHKTLPALQKTPDLGTFPRAGRMYSRMRIKQAKRKIFAYELSRL